MLSRSATKTKLVDFVLNLHVPEGFPSKGRSFDQIKVVDGMLRVRLHNHVDAVTESF